eukprot:GHVU01192769.1.p1 GENE.GHVU01192769.1~~GHVU01192769.1.p1  ORF type:complete len:290 (+),score=19.54 GHVU01192769.1:63-932(+)
MRTHVCERERRCEWRGERAIVAKTMSCFFLAIAAFTYLAVPANAGSSKFNVNIPRILGDLSGVNIANSQVSVQSKATGNECVSPRDCLGKFGNCVNGHCLGFFPDIVDERVIKCIDGYNCFVKSTDLPGVKVSGSFQVIAIDPSGKCGASAPLSKTKSAFANDNRWRCEDTRSQGCQFVAGVGIRKDKTRTVDAVRLCGCPAIDVDGDGEACGSVLEFYVPLARITLQECITNAHCIDHKFAYCVQDHCANFFGIAATTGIRSFACLADQQCTIEGLTSKNAVAAGLSG